LRDVIKKAGDHGEVLGIKFYASEITDHGGSTRAKTMQTARRVAGEAQLDALAIEPEDVRLFHRVAVKFVSVP